eukprot:6404211-Prymnesium_polylepis.1
MGRARTRRAADGGAVQLARLCCCGRDEPIVYQCVPIKFAPVHGGATRPRENVLWDQLLQPGDAIEATFQIDDADRESDCVELRCRDNGRPRFHGNPVLSRPFGLSATPIGRVQSCRPRAAREPPAGRP